MFSSALAQAAVLGFSEFAPGTVVTSQYATATFSSISGEEIRVANDFNFGVNSSPNYICTAAVGGGLDCLNPVTVNFTSPVNGLSFLALGDDAAGTPGHVDVFNGANLLGSVNIVVDGIFNTTALVDLSAFASVTRITISANTDPGGLAYDTFTFNVPEPASGALLLVGAILILRRRR